MNDHHVKQFKSCAIYILVFTSEKCLYSIIHCSNYYSHITTLYIYTVNI